MIIKTIDKPVDAQYAYLNIYPDQFVTESVKKSKSYIKNTMDYFRNIAFSQYRKNKTTFVKNYDLLKGIIDYKDFYAHSEQAEKDFFDTLLQDTELDEYVKHYSILNTPFNTLVGELANRPDTHRFRAFDEESKSLEYERRTSILKELVINLLMSKLNGKLNDDEQKEIIKKAGEYISDYTSTAEIWANRTSEALKAEFRMKEKGEDAFKDLLTSGREYFIVDEDNSKTGFTIENLNPKNYWELSTPDNKYTSRVSRQNDVSYCNGTVHVMELSEIIERFNWLTPEEISHLTEGLSNFGLLDVRESNVGKDTSGFDTVTYDTYNKLLLQERMMIEGEMKENNDELNSWMGISNSVSSFGYKYSVVKAFVTGKKKIGLLTYYDETKTPRQTLIDESYKTSPNEISIEWGWINQMYKGVCIGTDIYHYEEFNMLPYSPIIGVKFEQKNTTAKSLIDMMKPYQMIFNLALNQVWNIAEKEWGVVYVGNIRKIPNQKDGDNEDALDIFKTRAIKEGLILEDDSPENMKAPTSNTSVTRAIDLSRTNEIVSRLNIASVMKDLCWELVGVNKQRAGSVQATETATANQNALQQSFAQTEPWFVCHEYVMDQVYQAMIDAAQYKQLQNPSSTLSFINNQGINEFLKVEQRDLMADLRIFNVSRPKDQALIKEMRQLSQAMLQNEASPYDIFCMYTSESMREIEKKFLDAKNQLTERYQQERQLKQQEIESKNAQFEKAQQAEYQFKQYEIENENIQKELDRISKERIAVINSTSYGKTPEEDGDKDGVPDVLEISKLGHERQKTIHDYDIKLNQLALKQQEITNKMEIEKEKIKLARDNQKNDLLIAKQNAKNRSSK